MRDLRSIKVILPITIAVLGAMFVFVAIYEGVSHRDAELYERSNDDINRTAARLARMAEYDTLVSNQLLEDSLTQEAADERVAAAIVTNNAGKIIYSTQLAWRGQPVEKAFPWFDKAIFEQARSQKKSVVVRDNDDSRIQLALGFTEQLEDQPGQGGKNGVIFLVYDLGALKARNLKSAMIERAADILVGLASSGIILLLVSCLIARPLANLQEAADKLARGTFDSPLALGGITEVKVVGVAFNRMADSLKTSLKSLANQIQKTESILDNVVDGILTIDAEGNVISFNRSAEKMFGYSAQEVIGQPLAKLMPKLEKFGPENRADAFLATLRIEKIEGLRKNGSLFPIEFAANWIEDVGRPIFVGIVRDITEREKVDRMQKEFISTVSHELRTPLTAINGSVALLKNVLLKDMQGSLVEVVNIAERNGERLLNLINDLLDFEKIMAGKAVFSIRSHNLQDLLGEAVRLNESYAKKFNTKVELVQFQDSIRVDVDEVRLGQVVTNFISNACKFSPAGSVVKVVIQRKEDRVRVSVIDQGEGIGDDFKDRIFQKFSQADSSDKRQRGGTGLGLAISKGIIETMQGNIGFESEKGKGSTFYFELPLTVERYEPAQNHEFV